VQSLVNYYQPSGDHRVVPRHQPLRRQSAADAGRISTNVGHLDPVPVLPYGENPVVARSRPVVAAERTINNDRHRAFVA